VGLGPRLDLRQTQSLVMTPQLQQAIKLLALSNLEIEAFIGDALAANPLLEIGAQPPGEPEPTTVADADVRRTSLESSTVDRLIGEGRGADDRPLDIDPAAGGDDRDTGDGVRSDGIRGDGSRGGENWSDGSDAAWGAELRTGGGEDGPGFEDRGRAPESLADYLIGQIGVVAPSAEQAGIARYIVGLLDDAGYLCATLREVCDDLGIAMAEAEAARSGPVARPDRHRRPLAGGVHHSAS